jgi:AcrR family transcriptional regulator
MPRAFSESEKQVIEETLLEQGQKQFSAFGLRKTNVEEIAQAAGISKGAFYLFFQSKEQLFLRVMEEVEKDFRRQALKLIDRPGPTPRARLTAILIDMFGLWDKVPILHIFGNSDYQTLLRRMPHQTMADHLRSDMKFMGELYQYLDASGIHLTAPLDVFMQLMYAMFLLMLHGSDLGPGGLDTGKALLLELIAAYALGELPLESDRVLSLIKEMSENELRHHDQPTGEAISEGDRSGSPIAERSRE